MATTTNDLLSAIDAYMLSKGKGMGYLASKVNEIFEDKDAPLNAKTGPLSIVAEMFDDLQIKIKALHIGATAPLAVFKKETTWLNKSLKSFNKKILDSMKVLDTVDAFFKAMTTISKPSGTGPSGMPYKLTSDGLLKVSLWGMLPKYSLAGIPVYIKNISDHVVDKFLRNSTREKVLSSPIPIETADKKPNQVNNTIFNTQNNDKDKEKGGWLSSILGIGAGLLGMGLLSSEMDKSSTGKHLKKEIKNFLSKIFDSVGTFLSDKKTINTLKSGLGSALSGVWWILEKAFSKIIIPVFTGLMDEAPTIAKAFLFKGISWLNKKTFKIFDLKNWEKNIEGFLKNSPTLPGKKGIGGVISKLSGFARKIAPKLLKGLKWIPGLGTLISFGFGIDRIWKGDYFGGFLEIASGIAYIFPGVGTAIGLGIDALNMFLDYKQDSEPNKGKASILGGSVSEIFSSARKWIEDKIGKNLKDLPIIGHFFKIGEYIEKMKNDPLGGLRDIMSSLGNMITIPGLSSALSFINWMSSPDKGNDVSQVTSDINSWYNPLKLTDKISNWAKSLYDSATSIFNGSPEVKINPNDINTMMYGANNAKDIKNIKAEHVNDATVIQPHSKDQILMAKSGGPFDLAMKQMNNIMRDKFDTLIDIMTANVHATIEGSGAIVKTVAATSNKGGSSPGGFGSSHDPIRSMRNQVNNSIR